MPDTPSLPDTAAAGARWHAMTPDTVLEQLDAGREGLSREDAAARLEQYGPNRLETARRRSRLARLVAQLHNLLIYALIAAAFLAAAIGHVIDAVVIAAVVIVNAAIGYIQEGRAERALDAIRGMIDPHAAVLRDGKRVTIPACEVVPGDIVLLEAGDRVPADMRLVKARSLRADEAILTGESVPVDKTCAKTVPDDAPLGDRHTMAFSGTLITAGQATGVVVATGKASELGRISAMLGEVERLTTPLLRQMNLFARQLTIIILGMAGLVFVYAAFSQHYAFDDAFMAMIGLIVAAIPEGLPAVMTITLAIGVQRMAGRNAIIRRLPAVETLGAVSVICSDKTGTLTRNEMMVAAAATGDALWQVSGTGYAPDGEFTRDGSPVTALDDPVLAELCRAALLCNDAGLRVVDGTHAVDGDPMEGALMAMALKAGLEEAERERLARIDAIPFDPRHRYMATLHKGEENGPVAYVKGAPERILDMCAAQATAEGETGLDPAVWQEKAEQLALQGQRVLAFARKGLPAGTTELNEADVETGLVLLGITGLIDPPRPEAIEAVAECRRAGIAVKMITGDHAGTARAIAIQLGLAEAPDVMTGQDLDKLDADGLAMAARKTEVFARTSPEHKLRLVEAMQADGSVIAMTGDGVNDAPALKRADVGIAMGKKGTEAAKEASEMVLADDNFASIVAAVREGRTVYDNLTKVIAWTLPTNGGEALTIILAIAFGLTLPISPVQILWINMVTAVALGLTLAFEPTEPNAMRRPPRATGTHILSGRLLWRVVFVSILMVIGTFGVYFWAVDNGLPLEAARTLAVNAIVVMEIFYLFSVRFAHGTSMTWRGALGTRPVLIGVGLVVLAQMAFTYLPFMNAIFGTAPVGLAGGALVLAAGVGLLVVVEAEKAIASALARRRDGRAQA
ncbi:HAD superfamily P-type ATPase [Glycocaulis alkaliphilus]|uniref:HAD superfamily P-type ATPase n=1 Tax=Glycocaulis alkaliphilus TaxID=1434191 RepID=A0A3T0EA02_9PROT|nr:HAD-IC family P-type ATPase [Glycocaulis alkaliphilus]AZU04139.1 HAD superfamily P-type ATPase [Glycocaulis alkaliphilus]GGB76190.1 carbonate dehydratase [Glycocaulis alkaliphilus]